MSLAPELSPAADPQERALVAALDRAVNGAARQFLPVGARLFAENEPVEGIWLILQGQVQLSRRAGHQQVRLESDVCGRIVGLLSFAQPPHTPAMPRTAFFTCTARTEVLAAGITWQQLDEALAADPILASDFARQLIRSLGQRVRHGVHLQTQVQELNGELAAERDRLTAALEQLSATQSRLIESGRMAMLGQLVAGVAHELNNPATAIGRAAHFLLEDLGALLASEPALQSELAMIRQAATETPLPSREARQKREQLGQALGDEALAHRLVALGIGSREELAALLPGVPAAARETRLARLEAAHELGRFVRNIQQASERIERIVSSLRTYARVRGGVIGLLDLNRSLEDATLLLAGDLKRIAWHRDYGSVPPIEGDAGQLGQVWTNLIANALDAMGGSGVLTLKTDAPDPDHVRVQVIDSGPGIRSEHLPRVFELNFTTKHGPGGFGLGMGLVICRQVIQRHGGRIEVASRPGWTCFTVLLPVRLTEEARRDLQTAHLLAGVADAAAGGMVS